MTTPEALVYDDSSSADPSIGVIETISRSLTEAGVEPTPLIYEEALELARNGLLGASRDRLRMLLCLDPENGDARLLLAKVFVGQQRWSDALSQLDAARALGVQVPSSLQAKVESGLETERNALELQSQRAATREQAELKALRSEARRLRTDNTRLARDRKQLRGRITTWSASTAVLAGVSLVLLVFLWLGPSETDAVATNTEIEQAPPAVAQLEAAEEPVLSEAALEVDQPAEVLEILREEPAPGIAPPTSGPRTHEVVSGDSLYEIARAYYGDGSKWKAIKDANPEKIGRRNRLSLGTKLTIP